ncbi:MAG: hypothetical protein IKQ01_01095 [Bacteroidales bacterium]|nr:hypothetical protein [Bacteroidales bacterium]
MIKLLKIILTILITSFYFFPVDFTFLPINTKNLLAAVGIIFVIIELVRTKDFSIPRQLLILLLISSMVSIMSLISITYNQTPDDTYVTYIRSAVIWLSGAFAVGYIIRAVHGRIDVPIMVHYLIGVCLFQCVSAMLINFIPSVREFVDHYIQQGQNLLIKMGRLYGIGASLDVAGSRFAAVLVAIAFLIASSPKRVSIGMSTFYFFSFIVITIVGNMIARTTIIGTVIGIIWIILASFILPKNHQRDNVAIKGIIIIAILVGLTGFSVVLYNTNPDVKDLFRFAFEGFFNWVESGDWQTDSTNKLQSMVVWPEELRTWLIGDGYFANSRYDPNYLGDATDQGFYMGTDIGYLRFIFYFGILGLVWMIAVIAYSAFVCADCFKSYSWLFVMALLVGLIVWGKVSTDIFLFFCLFLSTAALQELSDEETGTYYESETIGNI